MGYNDYFKRLGHPSSPQQQQPQSTQSPGKQTLTQGLVGPASKETGSPIVDQGLGCDAAKPAAAHCLYTYQQRARMLTTFHSRVTAAQANYVAALIELRVDELLKKEPEQSDIMLELFLEIIGGIAVTSVMKAFKLLRSGAADALDESISNANALTEALRSEAVDKQVETAIKTAVSTGKKKVIKAASKSNETEEHTEKTANIAFLDVLTDRSASVFEGIRERTPAGLDDAAFAVLFASYRAEDHTVGDYKSSLEEKLKRFKKSTVGDIGVTRTKTSPGSEMIAAVPSQVDTKAFWVVTPQGKRLGLYRRGHAVVPDRMGEFMQPSHYTSEPERADWEAKNEKRPYTFMHYVPIEFEDAALAMHRAQWHDEPGEREAQTLPELTTWGAP